MIMRMTKRVPLSKLPVALKDRSMDMPGEKKQISLLISLLDWKKKLYRQYQEDQKYKIILNVARVSTIFF